MFVKQTHATFCTVETYMYVHLHKVYSRDACALYEINTDCFIDKCPYRFVRNNLKPGDAGIASLYPGMFSVLLFTRGSSKDICSRVTSLTYTLPCIKLIHNQIFVLTLSWACPVLVRTPPGLALLHVSIQ